jgi:hypothetical protein
MGVPHRLLKEVPMFKRIRTILPAVALALSILLFLAIPREISGDTETCLKNLDPPIPREPWCCWCIPFEEGTICWEVRQEGSFKDECHHGIPGFCPEEGDCRIGIMN